MELFKRRPLALICFLSICAMIFSSILSKEARIIIVYVLASLLLISLTVVSFLYIKQRHRIVAEKTVCLSIFLLLATILIAGLGSFLSDLETVDNIKNQKIHITGVVDTVSRSDFQSSSLKVTILSMDEQKCNIRAILEIDSASDLDEDDRFSLVNTVTRPENEYSYLLSDGISAVILCEDQSEIAFSKHSGTYGIKDLFQDLNLQIKEIIEENTDKETSDLTGALLLGNRADLSNSIIRDFRRCGISHMLALSGLHMSIIMGFFDFLLRLFFVDKRIRCVILIILSIAYLALTGFSPSAVRAVIMLSMVYIGHLMKRDSENMTALFIALTLILVFSPTALYDVGLWMSFFATLGIIVISSIISGLKHNIKKKPFTVRTIIKTLHSTIISFSAIFSICVFLWLFFGEISLVTPITNLIFSPIMSAVLILGLLTVILSPIHFLSSFLGKILIFVCTLFEDITYEISHLKGITVSLKYDFVPYIIIPLVISLVIFLLIKLRHKWIMSIPPIIAVIAFSIALSVFNSANYETGNILYVKDKRSETITVSTISEVSVCDISTGGYLNLYLACTSAAEMGATEIENVIITHYHEYHASSLKRICNSFIVRNIYLPKPETQKDFDILNDIYNALEGSRADAKLYKRESNIPIGCDFHISISESDYIRRSEHPLFLVSVSNENKKLVYATSAIEESHVLSKHKAFENANMLIIGSHGPTVKPFENTEFFDSMTSVPQTVIFTSPDIRLEYKQFVSYVNKLYQNGHTVIIDDAISYLITVN